MGRQRMAQKGERRCDRGMRRMGKRKGNGKEKKERGRGGALARSPREMS